ncbi:DUF5803 family protein [Methanolapillus ohkumae]|uniref:Uncharacterized protein n=1 Tax=Methanolapillus ohkumae TaxID=3028298 RepID=A0AA96ZV51_9EURY|nr:hypothetical protein MsAm2_01040 [Methanosarcinaceae archaeon Am2]
MKISLKNILLIIFLSSVAVFLVFAAGCISNPLDDSVAKDTDGNVSQIYNISAFVPVINNTSAVVESGSYVPQNTKEIQVVRVIDNKSKIPVIQETGLLVLSGPELKDVYFLTVDNFSLTEESLKQIYENPVPADISYTLKKTNSGANIESDQNFSGILLYTLVQSSGENTVLVNDNAKAVQITLPAGTTTGNRLLGVASPEPDAVLTGETGQEIFQWNAPKGKVSVKYYNENAPMYMIFVGIALVLVILAIYFYYRNQIQKLKKITESVDPDGANGFRKQRK